MYNVTLRRLCANIVAVGKQWVLHSLYLNPTHALILKQAFIFTHIKTLKLLKMFCKSVIINP
jgi:hypothetical protein